MIYIIVEGQTDKALVQNILSRKIENTDFKFLGLQGIASVKNTLSKLNKHDLNQNKYFAMVDADADFHARNKEMEELTKANKVAFYIFPNHKDSGDLETLLLSSIDKDNKIIKCFGEYQRCVGKQIDNKAKLYAYTTLEHDRRPEEYIKELTLSSNFDDLKQKLTNLFKEEK